MSKKRDQNRVSLRAYNLKSFKIQGYGEMIHFYFFFRRSPGKFIAIRSEQKDSSPDGSYSFSYETENGISVSESGYPQVGPQGQTEVNNHFILLFRTHTASDVS